MTIQGLQPHELPETPPADVEAGIRPLVDAINATGWMRTRQSCEGHPERGEGPWVWVQIPRYVHCSLLFTWMERANGQLPEWLIDASYKGRHEGWWFELRGRYVNEALSARVLRALEDTL